MFPLFIRLADPSHILLWPEGQGRTLNPDGEIVDSSHPYWAAAIADGSVVVVEPAPPPAGAPGGSRSPSVRSTALIEEK
jgi:hypothetical protein